MWSKAAGRPSIVEGMWTEVLDNKGRVVRGRQVVHRCMQVEQSEMEMELELELDICER